MKAGKSFSEHRPKVKAPPTLPINSSNNVNSTVNKATTPDQKVRADAAAATISPSTTPTNILFSQEARNISASAGQSPQMPLQKDSSTGNLVQKVLSADPSLQMSSSVGFTPLVKQPTPLIGRWADHSNTWEPRSATVKSVAASPGLGHTHQLSRTSFPPSVTNVDKTANNVDLMNIPIPPPANETPMYADAPGASAFATRTPLLPPTKDGSVSQPTKVSIVKQKKESEQQSKGAKVKVKQVSEVMITSGFLSQIVNSAISNLDHESDEDSDSEETSESNLAVVEPTATPMEVENSQEQCDTKNRDTETGIIDRCSDDQESPLSSGVSSNKSSDDKDSTQRANMFGIVGGRTSNAVSNHESPDASDQHPPLKACERKRPITAGAAASFYRSSNLNNSNAQVVSDSNVSASNVSADPPAWAVRGSKTPPGTVAVPQTKNSRETREHDAVSQGQHVIMPVQVSDKASRMDEVLPDDQQPPPPQFSWQVPAANYKKSRSERTTEQTNIRKMDSPMPHSLDVSIGSDAHLMKHQKSLPVSQPPSQPLVARGFGNLHNNQMPAPESLGMSSSASPFRGMPGTLPLQPPHLNFNPHPGLNTAMNLGMKPPPPGFADPTAVNRQPHFKDPNVLPVPPPGLPPMFDGILTPQEYETHYKTMIKAKLNGEGFAMLPVPPLLPGNQPHFNHDLTIRTNGPNSSNRCSNLIKSTPEKPFGRPGDNRRYPEMPLPMSPNGELAHGATVCPKTGQMVSRFTPPPPPPVRMLDQLLQDGLSEGETRESTDCVVAQILHRWNTKLDTWTGARPASSRPCAPCPAAAQYAAVGTWMEKVSSWYRANFGSRLFSFTLKSKE